MPAAQPCASAARASPEPLRPAIDLPGLARELVIPRNRLPVTVDRPRRTTQEVDVVLEQLSGAGARRHLAIDQGNEFVERGRLPVLEHSIAHFLEGAVGD